VDTYSPAPRESSNPLVARAQLLAQHPVIIAVPGLAVLPHQAKHLAQRGECCTDQLVVRPDNEVDEALLERHTTLASAVAHRRQRHAACLLAITLEEELVGYSHGPLLGNIEWLQHIRSVGAFDDDFHLELLVNLAVIGGGSRVRKSGNNNPKS